MGHLECFEFSEEFLELGDLVGDQRVVVVDVGLQLDVLCHTGLPSGSSVSRAVDTACCPESPSCLGTDSAACCTLAPGFLSRCPTSGLEVSAGLCVGVGCDRFGLVAS